MKYPYLIAIAFIFNGITGLGIKMVGSVGGNPVMFAVLLAMYISAAIFTAMPLVLSRRPVHGKSLLIGLIAGVSSAVGTSASARAVSMLPGYIVFPASGGGAIILLAVVARFFMKEKLSGYGLAGIIAGTLAIVLLSIPD